MNKQFKYIWEDTEKKWYMANEVINWLNRHYDISFLWAVITQVDETFIENEPTLWELIK